MKCRATIEIIEKLNEFPELCNYNLSKKQTNNKITRMKVIIREDGV